MNLNEKLRYRATAFQGAPLSKLMIEAAEFIEKTEFDMETIRAYLRAKYGIMVLHNIDQAIIDANNNPNKPQAL